MVEQLSATPVMPAAITVDSASDGAVIVLAVRGTWDVALRAETFKALRQCLAAQPAGLLIDLNDLHDVDALSLRTWANVRSVGAAVDPRVLVALCVPAEMSLGHLLQRNVSRRYLPVYARRHQAGVALGNLIPASGRLVLHLDAEPHAPGRARRLVDQACRTWNLQHLEFDARLAVTELVANAVRHAGTDIRVTLLRRGGGLHLIVADRDHRLPQLRTPEGDAQAGSGLHLVQAVVTQWDTISTSTGKMVWATLQGR